MGKVVQGEAFQKLTKIEVLRLNKEEQIEYYKKLREHALTEEFDTGEMDSRKRAHELLSWLIKGSRILSLKRIHIIHGSIEEIDRPLIFAPTHSSIHDIPILSEVIAPYHYYLLSGDYQNLPGTFNGFLLEKNGIVYFDRDDKNDRRVAKETSIRILQNGGNMMIYPEATWNISENLLVLPLYIGIIEIARRSNAVIIPVGMEPLDSRNHYINIGNPFYVNDYDNDIDAIHSLRDTLALLKWEIFEAIQSKKGDEADSQIDLLSRSLVSKEKFDNYIEKRIRGCSFIDRESLLKYVRKDKNAIEPEEVTGYFYRPEEPVRPKVKAKTNSNTEAYFFTNKVNK